MPYCVGIDGGCTKTAVELRWSDYSSNTRAVFGPLNCNSDRPATAKTLADTMAWLAAQPGGLSGCGALCIGSAGISNPDAYHFLRTPSVQVATAVRCKSLAIRLRHWPGRWEHRLVRCSSPARVPSATPAPPMATRDAAVAGDT